MLNKAYVPSETTVNQLEKIIGKIFEVKKTSFSGDELSVESMGHNKKFILM